MKIHGFVLLASLTLALPAFAQTESGERWLTLTNSEVAVRGLPWFQENSGDLSRLPERSKSEFRSVVWNLAQDPSGARVCFRSDTKKLVLRVEYATPPNMRNMEAFGQTGVDAYVDGDCINNIAADTNAAPGKVYQEVMFNFAQEPRQEREITLYLPLYKPVKILGIGIDAGAHCEPAKPFALDRPVVYYGTSITQGSAASRPGMSYEAMIGRKLNLDYVNLGFSGNGLAEPAVARAVAEIDAACFVVDFGHNHRSAGAMEKVYPPFLDALRAKHPATPILCISPIYTWRERRSPGFERDWQERRDFIRKLVATRKKSGDKHIFTLDGSTLLAPVNGDALVDGTHPTDLGFYLMADKIGAKLKTILKLH